MAAWIVRPRNRFVRILLGVAGALIVVSAVVTALNFPYDTDSPEDVSGNTDLKRYYEGSYQSPPPTPAAQPESGDDAAYVQTARQQAVKQRIPEEVRAFVAQYGLRGKRVLEVGAGSGLLQDIVDDYTALDISPSARQYFHKPFTLASATAMPFPDSSFDAVWSIWVLEHVPNPERALEEMRRVVKNNGYILLHPRWNCPPWTADGYEVRPYSDFGWKGKLVKASIPIRDSKLYQRLYVRQVRFLRWLASRLAGGPTRLRFQRLTPNYSKYWVPDSDAAVSIDPYEALLWFSTRGDVCRNCPDPTRLVTRFGLSLPEGLILEVHKRQKQ